MSGKSAIAIVGVAVRSERNVRGLLLGLLLLTILPGSLGLVV